MKNLFTPKNVVIMALIAIICIFLVNMFSKREVTVFNNNYKGYEYSDDDMFSDNQNDLDLTYTPYDHNKNRTLA